MTQTPPRRRRTLWLDLDQWHALGALDTPITAPRTLEALLDAWAADDITVPLPAGPPRTPGRGRIGVTLADPVYEAATARAERHGLALSVVCDRLTAAYLDGQLAITTTATTTTVQATPEAPALPDCPAARRPALAVACPTCGAAAGQLCTSHSGTRVRRNDVHQARTAAYTATREAAA